MTTSSKKSGGVDFNLRPLDDRLLFCSTSAPYGTHAQQQNPAKAGTFGYVTNRFDNSISVIDTAKNAVVGTIPVGGGPFGVAITPDGAHAYVANQLENTVSVIDAAENTVVATIPVGAFPTGVAVTSDGARPPEANDSRRKSSAYVTNTFDDTVSVVDTASNKVVATIPVGTSPFAVAFATVTPSHRSSEQ